MAAEEILSGEEFRRCVEFHGHICPGLAIGFQAGRVLMKRLGASKAPDEELLAIVENDACGVDAIQVMTGCTFGKGNLIFRNYGKHAFSLIDRKRERALRVCFLSNVLKADTESLSLSEKVQKDEASQRESARFKQLQQERTQKILEADAESLFKIEEIPPDLPPKARIVKSGVCDFCKELTKIDLLHEVNGKKACIPCAREQGLDIGRMIGS